MAQFDVHRNRGPNRRAIPYVVVVQSSIFDSYRRRVVVPLVKQSYLDQVPFPRFNPTFVIEGTPVVLHPLEVVSVAIGNLGKVIHQSCAERPQPSGRGGIGAACHAHPVLGCLLAVGPILD